MKNPVALGAGRALPSDIQIENESARMAALCRRTTYGRALALVERSGVNMPAGQTCFTQKKRMHCERWWTRQLRRVHWRKSEQSARESGDIWKHGQLYCSDHAIARFRLRRANTAAYMNGMAAINQSTGQVVRLGEAAEHNLSSLSVRRSEMIARTKGMESYARAQNWRGEFWTVSTPSRFHAKTHDGRKNIHYKGATPSEARDWLQGEVWSLFRTAMDDAGIDYCALRIAEPHHDGTPHLHIVIFFPRNRASEAGTIMALLAMADTPPKNQEIRFKAEIIKQGNGESAVGYVIKYVCKVIDGQGVGHLKVLNAETGELETVPVDAASGAERVRVWASLWGIRQFQFSGMAKVGPYRELRRVDAIKGEVPAALLLLHVAAKAGSFVDYLGNDAVLDLQTYRGEETRGEYGDRLRSVEGIYLGAFDLSTRDQWEIMPVWVLEEAGGFIPVPQSARPVQSFNMRGVYTWAPRTRLNNCREYQNHGQKPPKPPDRSGHPIASA